MTWTHKQRILGHLWAISPRGATNGQIRDATGIRSHQQVYLLTQELIHAGMLHGERRGRQWVFWVDESVAIPGAPGGSARLGRISRQGRQRLSQSEFLERARRAMSAELGVPLAPGEVAGVPQQFEMVSPDNQVIGDVCHLERVGAGSPQLTRFSMITERVWLLEKTGAPVAFLLFGGDQQMPVLWLKRYGILVSDIAFYFMSPGGALERLNRPTWLEDATS